MKRLNTRRNINKGGGPPEEKIKSFLKNYESKRYDEAQKIAIWLTKKFPKHAFGWKALSALFQQIGKFPEALSANRKVVSLLPQDSDAHYASGNILFQLGRLEEAETSCKRAIALKPDFAEAHYNLGNILSQLGELKEAEASYTQSITIKPCFAEAHYNLSNILSQLGRLEEAECLLRKTITIMPDLAEAHLNLGTTLRNIGRYSEAATSFKRAIECKSDMPSAHLNLGTLNKELGNWREAEANIKQSIILSPEVALAHNNLGTVLEKLEKHEEAEASYRQAIELNADYADAQYNLGCLLQKAQRIEEAISCFNSVLKIDTSDNLGASLRLAILGEKSIPATTPRNFLKKFYKERAQVWDLSSNQYKGHSMIQETIQQTYCNQAKLKILDLGCGTGSLAEFLSSYSNMLHGVDLSSDMISKANDTGFYDSLFQKDIEQFLEETTCRYDMIIAAAVLIHFFDLELIFASVANKLNAGGKFIFSIFEETEKDKDLNSLLMYSHNSAYIERLAISLDLKICHQTRDIHEYADGEPISAVAYALEKKSYATQ